LGEKGDSPKNDVLAQAVPFNDLGWSGWSRDERPPSTYNLDADTRDRLIAHARQGAAFAVFNTASLLERVQQLERLVYLLVFVVVVIPLLQWLIR
jgi:hypothetical protein